jgi:hypothetical protein
MKPPNRSGLAAALTTVLVTILTQCYGQGYLTFTFEGAPRGTEQDVGFYVENGMGFGAMPGNVILCGGGIPGYPDNGTGYLEVPDWNLEFSFTNSTTPTRYFNLVSFDAAELHGTGPVTMEVVGYKGMAGMATNYFPVNSQTFQTFHLDSSFNSVYEIQVLNARFSLDNVVISGVPEPSCGTLVILGVLGWAGYKRMRGYPQRQSRNQTGAHIKPQRREERRARVRLSSLHGSVGVWAWQE